MDKEEVNKELNWKVKLGISLATLILAYSLSNNEQKSVIRNAPISTYDRITYNLKINSRANEPKGNDIAYCLIDAQYESIDGISNRKEFISNNIKMIKLAKKQNIPIYLTKKNGAGEIIKEIAETLEGYKHLKIIKKGSQNSLQGSDFYNTAMEDSIGTVILGGGNEIGCYSATIEGLEECGFDAITSSKLVYEKGGLKTKARINDKKTYVIPNEKSINQIIELINK